MRSVPGTAWPRLMVPGLAVLLTLLNCLKPLHMDDAAYHAYAAHLAEHPLDPYGFTFLWSEQPQPAWQVLAPPLLPYWWAAAIRLFGERPFCWKLWLLPFSLLLADGLYRLCRRFARGLEVPLVAITVLSPTVLPGYNLMLDVPALALGLSAAALFLDACDRASPARALLAGLLAGLAAQTKYTGLLCPAAFLLYGLCLRKGRLAVAAVGVAFLIFAGWEVAMARVYGVSHFLYHCQGRAEGLYRWSSLLLALVPLLGSLAPAPALLGLAALRARPSAVAAAGGFLLLAYVLLLGGMADPSPADVPYGADTSQSWPAPTHDREAAPPFRSAGWLVCGVLGAVAVRLCWRTDRRRRRAAPEGLATQGVHRRTDQFLVLWLLLEVAGFLVLTPFPAARRVTGLIVVGTILTGRLASRTCRSRSQRLLLRGTAAVGVLVGLGYYTVDLREAIAQEEVAGRAGALVRGQSGTVWYVGHWGFQFYAERAGMRAVVPGVSRLRAGDWLVIPGKRIAQQMIQLDRGAVRPAGRVRVEDGMPVRTVVGYYGSHYPLESHRGPRATVVVYRVMADFIPAPGEGAE